MKRLKEKLKAIRHIITDDEYAVYTVTIAKRESPSLIGGGMKALFVLLVCNVFFFVVM